MTPTLLAAAVLVAAADPPKLSPAERAVVHLTNAERAAADLPDLQPDPVLMRMARDYAAVMAKENKLGHDVGGKTFRDRMTAAGYQARAAGENVGQGYDTPKAAVAGWVDSKPHKANLLGKEFTRVGVAVATADDGTRYWCQIFAAPAE